MTIRWNWGYPISSPKSASRVHQGLDPTVFWQDMYWLVVWNIWIFFSIQLGMSSSQLTNSIIFQRGRSGQPPTSVDFPTGFVQTMGDWCSIACLKLVTCTPFRTINWCSHVWKIYLQNRAIFRVSVGKYASTMEHLGGIDVFFSQNMGDGPVHECFRLGCLLADMHNGISVRKEKILVKNTEISAIYYKLYIYIII